MFSPSQKECNKTLEKNENESGEILRDDNMKIFK